MKQKQSASASANACALALVLCQEWLEDNAPNAAVSIADAPGLPSVVRLSLLVACKSALADFKTEHGATD